MSDHDNFRAVGFTMHKMIPYTKLLVAITLLAVSLTAALCECKFGTPTNDWSEIVTTRGPDGRTISYQMMVYVDRPVMRSDQTCETYLRIRNTGKQPLELTSTYITSHDYVNGELVGEEIGDWEIAGCPLKLMPGEIKDVPYKSAIRVQYPDLRSVVGTRGFQFCGFGLHTNTVTVYVLPSRPFWLVLAAVAALAIWRAWLGIRDRCV